MKARLPFAAMATAGVLFGSPGKATELEPYQMVRSLQVLQDRIANGDHAALPLQQKLLGVIDQGLAGSGAEDFADPKNLRALLVYGLSGGNPRTLDTLLPTLPLEGFQAELGRAIADYASGDFARARATMSKVDPMAVDPELGAPLALVAATVLSADEPEKAVHLLDDARLLSPGTLIEEAALRRTVGIAAALKDAPRFIRASEQYVRRFLHSPYASQFANSFVAGIVALAGTLDLSAVEEVTAQMTNEQSRVIYLRLARSAAIEGHDPLLDFASRKAREFADLGDDKTDPRAILYANMASVTSDNVEDVLDALDGIDRSRLSVRDRELLDAAKAVARAVITRPATTEETAAVPNDEVSVSVAEPAGGAPLPADPDEFPVQPVADSAPAPVEPLRRAALPAPETDEQDIYVQEMRDKLKAIDALLEKENTQ